MPGRLTRLSGLDTSRTVTPPRARLRPRGLPPALEHHGIYAADNAADAALYGADLLGTHRVHVAPEDARAFGATYHAVLFRDVTLGYLDYGTDVTIDIARSTADQLIIVPASGASVITADGVDIDASPVRAATPFPGEPFRIRCDASTAHLVVRIDRAALVRHVGRLLGRPVANPPRFEVAFDLTTPGASRWHAGIQMLHAELLDPASLLSQGTGVGHLEEFVMSALLYAQRSDITTELLAPARGDRASVELAREFIEQRAAEPITIEDIADAAGVTVRTLQHHFRDDVGVPPSIYLRDLRLDRARAELADAGPDSGVTVAEVASRWELTHLGRFSARYRERFGELPSATLRR